MDLSLSPAPTGAGGAVASPPTLTPKQAMKRFEFFKPGTARDVILLGDLVQQTVHYVRSKNHKVLCTAQLGTCPLCLAAPTSDDVSTAHAEYVAPALVHQKKDRLFHQRVCVFTASMGEYLVEITAGTPARGHRFEVARSSSQKFRITLSKSSPRALAHTLPAWFDLLPWVRARFGLPQCAERPLQCVDPYCMRDAAGGGLTKPKQLDLTPQDVMPAEEQEAKAAKLKELSDKLKQWKAPPPASDAEPQPEPSPESEAKKPGDLAVHELVSDPANYGPKVRVAGGEVPAALTTDEQRAALRANRADADRAKQADAEARAAAGKKSRDGEGKSNRLAALGDTLDVLAANFPVPGTNGKHAAGKGGAK